MRPFDFARPREPMKEDAMPMTTLHTLADLVGTFQRDRPTEPESMR